jgi:hypothetical protein
MFTLALFDKDSQKNQVGYPGKNYLKANIHQEVREQVMRISEDVYPSVHRRPPLITVYLFGKDLS